MISGIGIDIVELKRIEKAQSRNERFVNRILTKKELEKYYSYASSRRKIEFLAGRFAAKEAFVKAVGTGIGKEYSFQDMEVLSDKQGKPQLFVKNQNDRIFVSISHSEAYAVAQVIIEVL